MRIGGWKFWASAGVMVVTALCAMTARAQPLASDYLILVFSQPTSPEVTQAYEKWYETEHVPDMLSVPGYHQARRLLVERRDTPSATLPPYITLYDVTTSDMSKNVAEVKRRKAAGLIRSNPAFDAANSVTLMYRALGPKVESPHPPSPDSRLTHYELIVLANFSEGHEAEFNQWYDEHHLPDVLAVPGFISGRRYRFDRTMKAGYVAPSYLAVFEIATADLKATMDDLASRRAANMISRSTAMSSMGMQVYFAVELGRSGS